MFEGEDSILAGGGEKYKNKIEMVKKLADELNPDTFKSLGGNPLLGVDSKGKEEIMKNPTKLQMVEALVDSIIEDKGGKEQSSSTEELKKELKDKKDYN